MQILSEQIGLACWRSVKVFRHFFGFSLLGKIEQEISVSNRKAGEGAPVQTLLLKNLTD